MRALMCMLVIAMGLGMFEGTLHRFENPNLGSLFLCSLATVLSVRDENQEPGHSEE